MKKNQTSKMSRSIVISKFAIFVVNGKAIILLHLKFTTNIHTIHSSPGKSSIIVYDNGYSERLEVGLTKRKNVKPNLLEQGETVSKSYLERVKDLTVLILFTSKKKVYLYQFLRSLLLFIFCI